MTGYPHPRLPVHPLRSYLAGIGAIAPKSHHPGVGTVGWRKGTWQHQAWERAKRDGSLTFKAADKLTTDLGLHPCQLWPEWFEPPSAFT